MDNRLSKRAWPATIVPSSRLRMSREAGPQLGLCGEGAEGGDLVVFLAVPGKQTDGNNIMYFGHVWE